MAGLLSLGKKITPYRWIWVSFMSNFDCEGHLKKSQRRASSQQIKTDRSLWAEAFGHSFPDDMKIIELVNGEGYKHGFYPSNMCLSCCIQFTNIACLLEQLADFRRHFCQEKKERLHPWISRVMSPTLWAMTSRFRSSSVPAAPCPFWSERVQADHDLEARRPQHLDAAQMPLPADEEWDDGTNGDENTEEPQPLEMDPSGRSEGNGDRPSEVFQTPPPSQPTPAVTAMQPEPNAQVPQVASQVEPPERTSGAESTWRRGVQRMPRNSPERHEEPVSSPTSRNRTEGGLETAIGEAVVRHLQEKTTRLEQQNEELVNQLLQMKRERQQASMMSVPTSWKPQPREPTTPQKVTPPTQSDGNWMSPQSFRCTPNGTRVPDGSPPPEPPPMPTWPVTPPLPVLNDFQQYEPCDGRPRKMRGVMGDPVYRVASEMSPREARTCLLEKEIADLKELLHQQALQSKPWPGYFHTPFVKHDELEGAVSSEVDALKRNAGIPSGASDVRASQQHVLGGNQGQVRASQQHVLGGNQEQVRASQQHALGGDQPQVRALQQHALGEHQRQARAPCADTGLHGLGDVFEQDRAAWEALARDKAFRRDRAEHVHGGEGLRNDQGGGQEPELDLFGPPTLPPTLDFFGSSNFGTSNERGRDHAQGQRGRSPSRHEVHEDADLKAVPITLPSLPLPEGKDASLEAGDWLIQLEPLIGDLSKNASSWWRQVKQATFMKYSQWLQADPLARLRIGAPDLRDLPQGFERLDQRVTSLLMQSVPKCIKDEVVATRELSTSGILFKIYRTYQPGGLGERSRLLEDLTAAPKTTVAQEVVSALRLWKRKASRAMELSAQLPDPLLLIRTLDAMAKPIMENGSQAAFRIHFFRMQHGLDVRPSLETVWLFYDLLLAEAETAMHSAGFPMTPESKTTKTQVKAMQQTPSSAGTMASATSSPWPCKFWLTESGCKQGQRCRWPHSWDNVADRANRCYLCSSTQHQQQECPTKTQQRPAAGGEGDGKDGSKKESKGKGKGKTKSKGDGGGKNRENNSDDKKEEAKPAAKTLSEETKSTPSGNGGSDKKPDTGAAPSTTSGTAELLQEATKLLKSLSLPTVKTLSLNDCDLPQEDGHDGILIDSGATHALRRARSWDEWHQAQETVVALAQGTTSKLRLKKDTMTLLISPDDQNFGNGIVPMGALAKLGFEVLWTGNDCRLMNSCGEVFPVQVVNGCPMVTRELGMDLMNDMEKESQLEVLRTTMVKTLIQQPSLLQSVDSLEADVLLTVMLKKEFPNLPDEICAKVVLRQREIRGEELPWNRRRRRQVEKSKRVVLHLFSGSDTKTWKKLEDSDTVVLCVDKKENSRMDLLGDSLMNYLLKIAASGKLAVIIGGPPCRTISACRYQGDNGPPPLRSEAEPYGLSSLTIGQARQVQEDAVLLFRMKLLYLIAQHSRPVTLTKVLFGLEQPQDPQEYRSAEDVAQHEYMSIWRTSEWAQFQELGQLQLCRFEQGAFGHCKIKPTTFAHNIDGIQDLDGAKAPEHHGRDDPWRHLPLPERMAASATWAEWAPGFKAALVEAIKRFLSQQLEEWQQDGSQQQGPRPRLCPLTEVALKKWKLHIENDHQPMRRDCRQCMEAAGRSRPHRRIQHPSSYCLSLDLSGRLKKGKDQFGQAHKYYIVGC